MDFEFAIPGDPVGKGRPRFAHNHAYTPEKTADYENLVRLSFRQAYPDAEPFPKNIPLCMVIYAYFPVPKSTGKKVREDMLSGAVRHTKKPDSDNIAKAICDALNGLAYHDDSQIITLIVHKSYSDIPKTRVSITEWRCII